MEEAKEKERRNVFHLGRAQKNERTDGERDKRKVNFNGGETRFAFGGKRRRKKKKKRFRCGEGEGKTFVKMDVGRVSFIESPRTREIEREKESPSSAPLEYHIIVCTQPPCHPRCFRKGRGTSSMLMNF